MVKKNGHIIPVAVFDISSSSVAGAHTLIPKDINSKISILASARLFSHIKEEVTIEHFVEQTISQIAKVSSTLKKADNHNPKQIQVILASPWFVSQTRTILYSKATDFVCSQKLVDSLIEKEISYITEHDMEKFGNMGKEGLIIEKQISQIKLNGYSTSKPFGKKIKSLELFLVVTVSPGVIINRFKNELQKAYGNIPINLTTSPYATFVVARDFLSAKNEFMVIDIGEEITDVAFIKNDLFLYQHSFPVGVYEVYRSIAEGGISNILEAGSIIDSFSQGKLSPSTSNSVQKALDIFGEKWQRSFQNTVGSSELIIQVPENAYIVCDNKFDHFFSTILESDLFIQNLFSGRSFRVTTINQEKLSSNVGSLDPGSIDETIIVGSLFVSRLL